MKKTIISVLIIYAIVFPAQNLIAAGESSSSDYETVKQIIYDSLGWAFDKDYDRLFSIWADDENILSFFLNSKSMALGITAFKKNVEKFRTPDFKATRLEHRDMRINFSKSGDVAWFSCFLDDCGSFKGQESCVLNALKTGVLEKRDGKWVMVQSHSSYPVDKIPEEVVIQYYQYLFQDKK